MPSTPITLYPFSAVYIGDYGSSSVLTPITDLRTSGASVRFEMPTNFVVSKGKKLQAGNQRISVDLVFYAGSDTVTKLSRGVTLTSAASGLGTNQYTLLLVAPSDTAKDSYYIPRVDTERVFETRYSKDTATSVGVTFSFESRSMQDVIMYKDTPAVLDTLLGIRSPI